MKFIMEGRNKASSAIAVLLIGVAFILQIVGFLKPNALITRTILGLLLMVALAAGILYLFFGATKRSAKYYKFFMYIYAAEAVYSVVAQIIGASASGWGTSAACIINVLSIAANVCAAVCICLLAFRKNLMKKPSLTLAWLNLIVTAVFWALYFVVLGGFADLYPLFVGKVVLTLVALIFVKQKYADKDLRGTI